MSRIRAWLPKHTQSMKKYVLAVVFMALMVALIYFQARVGGPEVFWPGVIGLLWALLVTVANAIGGLGMMIVIVLLFLIVVHLARLRGEMWQRWKAREERRRAKQWDRQEDD